MLDMMAFLPLSAHLLISQSLRTTTVRLMSSLSCNSSATLWSQGQSQALHHCFLPLSPDHHKGSSGRIGLLGGSEQYTGAPYYAAMASLHTGADLCYILTAHEAALPLKSYSPELMVTPIYKASEFVKQQDDDDVMVDDMVQAVVPLLDRLHVLVVGPGLGRQARVLAAVAQILQHAMTRNLFLVLDADALYLLTLPDYKNLIQNYKHIVLTPNAMEYQRLLDAHQDDRSNITAGLMVLKGRYDQVWQDNQLVYECQEPGGLKRSGGLGDILAGCIATLVAWHVILQQQEEGEPKEQEHSVALACWTACCIVKRATKRAFGQKRRSMTAPDVLEALGPTIMEMEGEELEC